MARFWMILLVSIGTFCLAACGSADQPQVAEASITTLQQAEAQGIVPTFTATAAIMLQPTPTPVLRQSTDSGELPTPAQTEKIYTQVGQQDEAVGVVIVSSNLLNVRAAPNTDAAILTTLASGACQQVKAREADWYLLHLDDGSEGWSAAAYLTPSATCPATPQIRITTRSVILADQQKGIITASSLNVRAGPGTTFEVLAQVAANDCVDVLVTRDEWVQITTATAVTGWCSQNFVTLVASCPATVQPIALPVAAPASPVQPVNYMGQPFAPNAITLQDAYLFECFGSGDSELRFVTAGTPVQVLGVGAFGPPYGELGSGPFVKIRLWDGQYAWLGAAAVHVELTTQPTVSAQCESYDRIDWSTIVPPTPTSYPSWVTNPTPSQPTGCCKICRKGKACGDSCISASYTCHKGPGCACNG